MGICIEYKGRMDETARLEELLADVREISQSFGWPVEDVTMHVSGLELRLPSKHQGKRLPPRLIEEEVRGVYVRPPDTETLRLLFNKKGRLVDYSEIPHHMVNGPASADTKYFMEFPLWVKTTGALDSHILLVMLLERLKSKFMKTLKIRDDSGFAKTGDFEKLALEHAAMGFVIQLWNDPGASRSLLKAAGLVLGDQAIPLPRQIEMNPLKRMAAKVH